MNVVRERATAVLIAAALIVYAGAYIADTPQIGYDGEQYLTFARNLLDTGIFTYDGVSPSCGRTPGYPAFLAAFLWATGGVQSVYPVQLVLLFASLYFVYRVFRPIFPQPWASALMIGLLALWPLHRLAMVLNTETLFLCLSGAGILALIEGCRRDSSWLLVVSGVALSLSAYVRPVTMLLGLFLAAWLLLRRRLRFKRAILVAISSIVVLMPWTIRNAVQFERFIPLAAHVGSFYYMTDAEVFWPVLIHSAGYSHTLPVHKSIVGDDLELDLAANDRYVKRGVANIRRDPGGFLLRCIGKTIFVWSYLPGTKSWYFDRPWAFAIGILIQWTFLLLAWRGWRLLSTRAPVVCDMISGYALYTTLILFPFYAESRFLLPVYIWLFALAMYAIYTHRERLPGWIRGKSGT